MYEPSPVYPLYDSDTCLYAQPDFGPTYSSAAVAPGMSGRIANVYYLVCLSVDNSLGQLQLGHRVAFHSLHFCFAIGRIWQPHFWSRGTH